MACRHLLSLNQGVRGRTADDDVEEPDHKPAEGENPVRLRPDHPRDDAQRNEAEYQLDDLGRNVPGGAADEVTEWRHRSGILTATRAAVEEQMHLRALPSTGGRCAGLEASGWLTRWRRGG